MSGVALVTGGARRVGRRIVERLAAAGWDVAIHCNGSVAEAEALADEIQATGRRAAVLSADLGDAEAAQELAGRAAALLGPLRLLVNNASLFEFDTLDDMTATGLDRAMVVNFRGPLLLAQGFVRHCAKSSDPLIVNILDQKVVNLNPDFFSYTLSKLALHGATQALACALAGRVRVHGLAPGLLLPSADQTLSEFERAHRLTPLGRASTPDDIASAILFMASVSGFSSDLTVVDGGQNMIPVHRDVMYVVREEV
jgi:NAD(P)-dependent dehydrogenase (short-subunit alcohol dehydrogenase family)